MLLLVNQALPLSASESSPTDTWKNIWLLSHKTQLFYRFVVDNKWIREVCRLMFLYKLMGCQFVKLVNKDFQEVLKGICTVLHCCTICRYPLFIMRSSSYMHKIAVSSSCFRRKSSSTSCCSCSNSSYCSCSISYAKEEQH